jgi:hypothetical protein
MATADKKVQTKNQLSKLFKRFLSEMKSRLLLGKSIMALLKKN